MLTPFFALCRFRGIFLLRCETSYRLRTKIPIAQFSDTTSFSCASDGFQSFWSGPQIDSFNFALLSFKTNGNRQFCIANIS